MPSVSNILLIEDSAAFAKVMESILEARGYVVTTARSGSQAREYISANYELILLDLVLPDTDGLDLLPELREQCSQAAIVIMTGQGGAKAATQAFSKGADGYIEKQHIRPGTDLSEFEVAIGLATENRRGKLALQGLEELKRDFFSMVTHDLRSPAASAVTALKLYRKLREDRLIDIMDQALVRLMSRIDKYLCFAKMDAGFLEIERESADFSALVTEMVDEWRPMAQEKRQTIHFEPKSIQPIPVDLERMRLALENLLSNAIKYTPAEGQITVSLTQDERETRLNIQDSGSGVSKERLPSLFDRYYRVPGARSTTPGTGLGLQIVKLVVEGHDGRVWAESKGVRGEGTCFVASLPNQVEQAVLKR